MAKTIKRETIHAGGIDIGIYTTDFKNELDQEKCNFKLRKGK